MKSSIVRFKSLGMAISLITLSLLSSAYAGSEAANPPQKVTGRLAYDLQRALFYAGIGGSGGEERISDLDFMDCYKDNRGKAPQYTCVLDPSGGAPEVNAVGPKGSVAQKLYAALNAALTSLGQKSYPISQGLREQMTGAVHCITSGNGRDIPYASSCTFSNLQESQSTKGPTATANTPATQVYQGTDALKLRDLVMSLVNPGNPAVAMMRCYSNQWDAPWCEIYKDKDNLAKPAVYSGSDVSILKGMIDSLHLLDSVATLSCYAPKTDVAYCELAK